LGREGEKEGGHLARSDSLRGSRLSLSEEKTKLPAAVLSINRAGYVTLKRERRL